MLIDGGCHLEFEGVKQLVMAAIGCALADYASGMDFRAHVYDRRSRKMVYIEHHYQVREWLLTDGIGWLYDAGINIDPQTMDRTMFGEYVKQMARNLEDGSRPFPRVVRKGSKNDPPRAYPEPSRKITV